MALVLLLALLLLSVLGAAAAIRAAVLDGYRRVPTRTGCEPGLH